MLINNFPQFKDFLISSHALFLRWCNWVQLSFEWRDGKRLYNLQFYFFHEPHPVFVIQKLKIVGSPSPSLHLLHSFCIAAKVSFSFSNVSSRSSISQRYSFRFGSEEVLDQSVGTAFSILARKSKYSRSNSLPWIHCE